MAALWFLEMPLNQFELGAILRREIRNCYHRDCVLHLIEWRHPALSRRFKSIGISVSETNLPACFLVKRSRVSNKVPSPSDRRACARALILGIDNGLSFSSLQKQIELEDMAGAWVRSLRPGPIYKPTFRVWIARFERNEGNQCAFGSFPYHALV